MRGVVHSVLVGLASTLGSVGPVVDYEADLSEQVWYDDFFKAPIPGDVEVKSPKQRWCALRAFQCRCELRHMDDPHLAMVTAWLVEEYEREALD